MEPQVKHARQHRVTGKDPPMRQPIPHDIRDMIYQTVPDALARVAIVEALEEHVAYLRSQDRISDCEEYLEMERELLIKEVAGMKKNKSRARLTVIATYLVPAFVTIITRVITDHMPFG